MVALCARREAGTSPLTLGRDQHIVSTSKHHTVPKHPLESHPPNNHIVSPSSVAVCARKQRLGTEPCTGALLQYMLGGGAGATVACGSLGRVVLWWCEEEAAAAPLSEEVGGTTLVWPALSAESSPPAPLPPLALKAAEEVALRRLREPFPFSPAGRLDEAVCRRREPDGIFLSARCGEGVAEEGVCLAGVSVVDGGEAGVSSSVRRLLIVGGDMTSGMDALGVSTSGIVCCVRGEVPVAPAAGGRAGLVVAGPLPDDVVAREIKDSRSVPARSLPAAEEDDGVVAKSLAAT